MTILSAAGVDGPGEDGLELIHDVAIETVLLRGVLIPVAFSSLAVGGSILRVSKRSSDTHSSRRLL